MKRTIALGLVVFAFAASNLRIYHNVPDPTFDNNVAHGLVFIVPSVDVCYGLEIERPSNVISPFGGECE